jgi:hypothetical protein
MAFLILVIGDLHIPDRALDIPAKVLFPSALLILLSTAHRLTFRLSSKNSSRPGKSAKLSA